MVIAAFYVIGSDVRAETVDEPIIDIDEQASAIEHLDRRLTISNDEASDPHFVMNGDVTCLVWVDGSEGSQRLMWKRSNDSLGTFTPDTALTTKFHSIDDISLCCSDGRMAAAFEAKMSVDSPSMIYYLYSSDGKDWSSAYSVAQGDSPVLIGGEGRQYLGMNIVNEGQRYLSIASIIANDDEINATILASLPIASGIFDMFMTDDLINIALNYEPSDQIVFVRLAENGTMVTSPFTIYQASELVMLDLLTIDGEMRLLVIEEGSIRLARCLGGPDYWSVVCLLETEGTVTGASMMVLDDNIRIAYALDDGNASTIFSFDCDMQGQSVRVPEAISTTGLNASSPALLSTSPDVISCIYVEEHHGSQELFLKYDMDFVIPDIPRLKRFIGSLDEDMLAEGNISREKLIEKLDKVVAFLENKNETAAVEEALALKASIEVYFVNAPYADLDAIQGSKDKIKKNLDTVKKDEGSGEVIVTSLPPQPGFDVTLSVNTITSSSAIATWSTTYRVIYSGYVLWGTSLDAINNRVDGTPSGSTYRATISGLNSNTTHYVIGHMVVQTVYGTADVFSPFISFKTYPTALHIYSIIVSPSSGSATISWTTDGKSTSRVDYGTTSSYGSYVSSSSLVTAHSLTLSNLASSTLYHYKITSAYSTTGFSLSAVTSDRTFTSATTMTVTVSSVASALTDLNSVRITWTTNVQATSVVNYGTTTSYGSSASGASGTTHTVDINGLIGGTLYHYKVMSAATVDPNAIGYSSDCSFTTRNAEDGNLGCDAGDDSATASPLTPGTFTCYLDSTFDSNDYYSISLLTGETLKLVVDVPSNFDYHLYLFNPSGTQVASSANGIGVDESIQYTINADGVWKMRVLHQSGTGQGLYGFDVQILGAWEHHYLDVGTAGDNDVLAHTPGMAIMDGTGWYAASSGMRETALNGSFLLNIYDDTYQSNTYYEVAIAYTSSADVGVSVLVGDSWVSVATLPGRSIAWTYSFVLKSDMLSDSSSSLFASNVRMRFDHQVVIDSIDAIPIAYASDFFGGSPCNPGVMLENNWQMGSAIVNGSAYATLIVSLPRTDVTYFLEFQNLDSCHDIGVQQWDGSAYDSIGTLESWGTSAVIQLDPASYYDVQSTAPGTNLRIRLTSPIVNLSRVILWTSQVRTDVGASGDSDTNARLPGVSIIDNGEWSAMTTLDSKTVRYTMQGMSANFLLNGALSDTSYIVSISYKATAGTASLYQYKGVGYGNYVSLGSLIVDGLWHTALFATSAENVYDYTLKGQINMIFWISSTSSVAVDSITVCRDSDGDGYSDALESLRITQGGVGTHAYDLNPFSADTDSDCLNDNVEISSYGTDPCDPDTDSDGSLDGSEKYSHTWSTDNSYLIPDNGALTIDLSLPAMPGAASSITSLCLVLGIMHGSQYQLQVKVSRGNEAQRTVKAENTGSGANYFVLRNLFVSPISYSASDLESANVWHIYIRDVAAGTQGRVEYARLQVNGTTNPLDNDSDDDSIEDGEEVEFGADGWYTNPRACDSDSDGVSDRNEIVGDVPCGFATDPTRADTDDDGYNDDIDLYMGDAVLRVTIKEYKTREDVNWGDDDCNIFFVIRYADQELSTKRLYAHTDVLYYPEWVYDIDIAETTTSVDLEFLAVADNAVITGDDEKLDVSPSGNLDHDVTWDMMYNSTTLSFQGSKDTFDHDTDAYMKVKLERAVSEKARVIVINGTEEEGDYGLDAVSTGVYRYSADDQVYMVVLNVTGSSAHFQSGMNAIILPRAIALQCQLNDTLYDLQNVTSTPLSGASFYSTNASSASASGHIIAVISKNVTASQAETILTMLTHNATGVRVGNNVTISSTSLYLLHLPSDILSAIPTSVMNAGLGAGPSFLDPLGTICDIANMVFDFLVWVATGGVLLLLAHLVKEGLKAISNLVSTAVSAIEAAVDRIVDAFCAMVDWMIDYICNMFSALIIEPLNSMVEGFGQWANGLLPFIDQASSDIEGGGDGSQFTSTLASSILNSEFFIYLNIIGLSLFIVITVASMLGPAGFISSLILPSLLNVIISGLISAAFYMIEDYGEAIWEILGDELAVGMSSVLGAVIGTIDWIKAMMSSPTLGDMKGFICSTFGIFFAWWAAITDDWTTALIFNAIGVGFAIYGAWSTFINPSDTLLKNPTALGIYKGIVIIEGGIATFGLITTVASYEQ